MIYKSKIIPGRGEGRKLGFPTLNLEIPADFSADRGIYAGWAWVNEEKLPAAIHYGPVPVFDVKKLSLEVHVIDREIEPAPKEVSFELVKHLRDIGDIPNVDALREQIGKDVDAARTILKGV